MIPRDSGPTKYRASRHDETAFRLRWQLDGTSCTVDVETDDLHWSGSGHDDLGLLDDEADSGVGGKYSLQSLPRQVGVEREEKEIINNNAVENTRGGNIRRREREKVVTRRESARGVKDVQVRALCKKDCMREAHRHSGAHRELSVGRKAELAKFRRRERRQGKERAHPCGQGEVVVVIAEV